MAEQPPGKAAESLFTAGGVPAALPAAGRKIKYLRGRKSMKRRESQQLGELQQTAKDFVGAMKRALADEDQFYRYV